MLQQDESQPTEMQLRFIRSLHKKVSIESIPEPKMEIYRNKQYRSGIGSFDDHQLMMQNYICACGKNVTIIDHSTSIGQNGFALDTYRLQCKNCGDNEEINFRSLRDTLFKLNSKGEKSGFQDPSSFPYI